MSMASTAGVPYAVAEDHRFGAWRRAQRGSRHPNGVHGAVDLAPPWVRPWCAPAYLHPSGGLSVTDSMTDSPSGAASTQPVQATRLRARAQVTVEEGDCPAPGQVRGGFVVHGGGVPVGKGVTGLVAVELDHGQRPHPLLHRVDLLSADVGIA